MAKRKATGTDPAAGSVGTVVAKAAGQKGLRFERRFTRAGQHPFDAIEWEKRDAVIANAAGEVVFEQRDVEVPRQWSQMATNVVVSKYFRGILGSPERETSVRQLIGRVVSSFTAWGVAGSYFASAEDAQVFSDELSHLLVHQKMSFNSPVWFNVGIHERPQGSACQPARALVSTPDGPIAIGDLVAARAIGTPVFDNSGVTRVVAVKANGVKEVHRILLRNGSCVEATGDHLVLAADQDSTDWNWLRVDELVPGQHLKEVIHSGLPVKVSAGPVATGEPSWHWVMQQPATHRHAIVEIEARGSEEVFDIQTETGQYLSNNIVVHNCFINSVEDTMESILGLAKTEGMLFKFGSGTGSNLSPIRSSREKLAVGGTASGPLSFMKGYDAIAGAIKSGGATRRAAKMVILNIEHPDVVDFINCKVEEERKAHALIAAGYDPALDGPAYASIFYQNANHSIRVSDEFMGAVADDAAWETRYITSGEVADTYEARDLMRQISEATWQCGDPGMQFDTTINDWHTAPAHGRINASNPCSEYMFLDDTACNLASLNLMKFVDESGEFAVEDFRHAVKLTISAQEMIVGFASYPTPAIEVNSHRFRTLGLGYANLGALLMSRGLPYDSDAGRAYAAAITSLMCAEAYVQSSRLAAAVGPCDGWEPNRQPMQRVIGKHRAAANSIDRTAVPKPLWDASAAAWEEAQESGARNGFRNMQVTVLAPTGTIAFMMDCDTTGIEPDIALVKYKRLVGGGMLKIVNQTVPEALDKLGYGPLEVTAIIDHIDANDTIEGAPQLAPEHLPVFDCAFKPAQGERSIHYLGHIRMMSATQPFISGAISKTVNLPQDATVDDIGEAYLQAWKLGLKAIAIYRDGCKVSQPLSTSRAQSESRTETAQAPVTVDYDPRADRRRLPDERRSITHKFSIEGHEGYITVGMYEDGSPGEIFLVMAKEGSTISGLMDAFATAISLALQYGVPLEALVQKFAHARFEPSGYTKNRDIPIAKSIVDYIFRWLASKFLSEDKQEEVGIVRRLPVEPTTPVLTEVARPESAAPTAGNGRTEVKAAEPTPQVAAVAMTEPVRIAFHNTSDAPSCSECGSIMVRNAACYKCLNCGATSGCS